MKRFKMQSCCQDEDEAAFASDVASSVSGRTPKGGIGCIWPPRSYACNFCKRDFRSAQALGGHMNVHRRDRALLKQVTLPLHYPPLDHDPCYHQLKSLNFPPLDHYEHDLKCCSKSMVSTNPSTRASVAQLSPSHNCVSNGFTGVISANYVVPRDYLSSKRCKKSEDNVAISFFEEMNKSSNPNASFNLRASKATEDLDLELRLGDSPNKV